MGTITNSPVKKQQTSSTSDSTVPKIAGPQRTLSLKKSPHLLRTRRQAKDDIQEQNSLTENEESAPECKVS